MPSIGHDDFTNVFRFSEEEEEEEFTPNNANGCPEDMEIGMRYTVKNEVKQFEVSGIDYPSFDGVVIHPYYADYDLLIEWRLLYVQLGVLKMIKI